MLAHEGIDCDLIDGGKTYAAASAHLTQRTAIRGGVDAIAHEVLRVAADYDRVIVCNERLIRALMRVGGDAAQAVLPGTADGQEALCTKTLFSPAARAGGLRVSDFEVAESPEEAAQAAARLGGHVAVKGRWGAAGMAVRIVDDEASVTLAAQELGCPVLVEAFVPGELINTPCLYENGKLVAGMAARKLELAGENGPSTVNQFLVIDETLRAVMEKVGDVFGLSGFASADLFITPDGGEPVVLEVNPRPVPQLHIGTSLGVDMARALADVLAGRWDGVPRLATRSRTVRLFPQSLIRRRELSGALGGTLRWALTPGAWSDVPWDDAGLLRRHLREFVRPAG